MKWTAYCTICGNFVAKAKGEKLPVLVSAQWHANNYRHEVSIGFCSCLGGRFVFTPLEVVRPSKLSKRKPPLSGLLTYYDPDLTPESGGDCLFYDEGEEGNCWDNAVKTFEEGRYQFPVICFLKK